jgi:hypothetical protein
MITIRAASCDGDRLVGDETNTGIFMAETLQTVSPMLQSSLPLHNKNLRLERNPICSFQGRFNEIIYGITIDPLFVPLGIATDV